MRQINIALRMHITHGERADLEETRRICDLTCCQRTPPNYFGADLRSVVFYFLNSTFYFQADYRPVHRV